MTAEAKLLRQALRAARWPTLPPVQAWVEEHVRFAGAVEASTRYHIGKSPFAIPVFEWWADRTCEEILLLWPTQAGKSALLSALLCYAVGNDPGPAMWVVPGEAFAKAFSRARLKPCLKATFPDLISDSVRDADWTEQTGATVGDTHIWPAWATSEARCRSWPRRYVFGDECSIWMLSRQFMLERTKQFLRNRKAIWVTTPTYEDEDTWLDFEHVYQQWRWTVECPACRVLQPMQFCDLDFSAGRREDGSWDFARVEAETRWKCPKCQAMIDERQRIGMVLAGRALCVTPERDGRRRALRVTALDVPALSWGATARAFVEARDNLEHLRTIVNGWLVEPWREQQRGVRGAGVLARVLKDMQPGVPPAGTRFLLAGVDVQHGHVYCTIRAWLKDWRSVLLWAGRVEGQSGSTEHALEDLIKERIDKTYSDAEGRPHRVIATAIDRGDGNTADEVQRVVRRHPGLGLRMIHGMRNAQKAYYQTSAERLPDGTPKPGSLPLWRVNSAWYRDVVHRAYLATMSEPHAWLAAPDTPREYAQHMESWETVVRKTRTGGVIRRTIQRHAADHFLDCEIYCAAIYDIWREVLEHYEEPTPGVRSAGPRYGVVGRAFRGR